MGSFGKRMKNLLDQQNMSQKELADKTGCTEAAISRYINGDRVPRAVVMNEIAIALNTSIEFLLSGQEENHENDIMQVEKLLARNANNMSDEEKMRIIRILSGGNNV